MTDPPRYSPALEDVIVGFQRWLHLPDPTPLLVSMAAVAATRGEGRPVWVIIVGAPSTAKTELISTLQSCTDVFPLSSSSVAGLLTTRKGAGPSDGVLNRIAKSGRPGTMLVRDTAALLFSRSDSSSDVLDLLRDAYDGTIEREGGFGQARASGKFGFLGAATTAIDRHHQVMGDLGPRFLYCRTEKPAADPSIRMMLHRIGAGDGWRAELAASVERHMGNLVPTPVIPDEGETVGLIALADVVSKARGYVPRDSRSEVDGPAVVEGPVRMAEALVRLFAALVALGCSRAESWRVVTSVGLDGMSQDRRLVLTTLAERRVPMGAGALADLTRLPVSSVKRTVEDLTMTGLLTRSGGDSGRPTWELEPAWRTWWRTHAPAPLQETWRDVEAVEAAPAALSSICSVCDGPTTGGGDHSGCVEAGSEW